MLLQFIIKADTVAEIESQAHKAMEAGVNWLEICAPEHITDSDLKDTIEHLRTKLADTGTVLIIGHRYEAAKEWQADGVHIYSTDRPISAVRVALEAWPIIGVNVENLEAAQAMRPYDIDYLFYDSDGTPEAYDTINKIARYLDENAIETPLVCGGDITLANVATAVDAGAAAIASSDINSLQELMHFTSNLTQKNI